MRALVVIAAVLLCTNLAFLAWSVHRTQQALAPLPAPPAPLSLADLDAVLAGMPGYSGTAPCDDLARFVAAINGELVRAGADALPVADPVSDALMETSCRLDDADVGARLLPYRRLFRRHNLTPPPAFAHFATPSP